MEGILEWGVDVIRAVQTIESPGLTAVMKALTLLGSEYFYLLFLPVVFWCVDERFGARFGLVFLFSTFVNGWLKVLFAQPRPYNLDPSVGLSSETSYGLPSGHSQGSATLWGLLAPRIKKPWGLVLAVGLPLLIGFTRIYLGVHFPTDLFLGWALGWGIAVLWNVFGERLSRRMSALNPRVLIVLAALVALGMNALNPDDTSISGVFFGTALGAVLQAGALRFDASSGSLGKKAARLGLGLAGTVALYAVGKLLSPESGSDLYPLVRFVRYGVLGVWVAFGAPWIFLRLRLASVRERPAASDATAPAGAAAAKPSAADHSSAKAD